MQLRHPRDAAARRARWKRLGIAAGTILLFLWAFWALARAGRTQAEVEEAVPESQSAIARGDDRDNAPEQPPEGPPTLKDYENWYEKQVEYCGELCTVDKSKLLTPPVKTSVESLRASYISRPVRCPTFFSKRAESLFDGKRFEWPPPKTPPVPFTVHDEAMRFWLAKDLSYSGGTALSPKWSKEKLESDIAKLRERKFVGSYGRNQTYELHDLLEKYVEVEGKRVLIVGTEHPWVETIVLKLGAREVVTLEYGRIETDHPRLKTMLPTEANALYRSGQFEPFDLVVSYSSLEHSGLGRYGDMINPWGDVIWMAKISCMVKHGGGAVIAVENGDNDEIVYNAHRVYGPYRWPLLLQNWEAIQVRRMKDRFKHGMVYAINRRSK